MGDSEDPIDSVPALEGESADHRSRPDASKGEMAMLLFDVVNAALRGLRKEADATKAHNYVEMTFVGMGLPFERAAVVLVRPDGKTPGEMVDEAQTTIRGLRRRVAELEVIVAGHEARAGAETVDELPREDLLTACAPKEWTVTSAVPAQGVVELTSWRGVVATVQARTDGRATVGFSCMETLSSLQITIARQALEVTIWRGHLDQAMDAVPVTGEGEAMVVWGRDALKALGAAFGADLISVLRGL